MFFSCCALFLWSQLPHNNQDVRQQSRELLQRYAEPNLLVQPLASADACTDTHMMVGHAYLCLFALPNRKVQVAIGLVRQVIANCTSLAVSAARNATRYFTAVELQDGSAKYFCHPWAEAELDCNGRLKLTYTKGSEVHRYYSLLDSKGTTLNGPDTSGSSDSDSDSERGNSPHQILGSNVQACVEMSWGVTPKLVKKQDMNRVIAVLKRYKQ